MKQDHSGNAGKQLLGDTEDRAFPSQFPCSSDLTFNFTVGASWGDAVWSVHFYQDVTVKPAQQAAQQNSKLTDAMDTPAQ